MVGAQVKSMHVMHLKVVLVPANRKNAMPAGDDAGTLSVTRHRGQLCCATAKGAIWVHP
jgi:hypothetical protein